MARISFTSYSNSALATMTDFLGSAYIFMGTLSLPIMLFADDPEIGSVERITAGITMLLIFALIGAGHRNLAKYISERKHYKGVIKKIKANGFEDKIRESKEFAVYVYRKFPVKMIKNYVIKLNREAESDIAQIIRAEKEEKNTKR